MRLLYSNSGGVDSCSLPLVRVCLELGRRMFFGDVLGRRHLCGLSSCEGVGFVLPQGLLVPRLALAALSSVEVFWRRSGSSRWKGEVKDEQGS